MGQETVRAQNLRRNKELLIYWFSRELIILKDSKPKGMSWETQAGLKTGVAAGQFCKVAVLNDKTVVFAVLAQMTRKTGDVF